VLAVHADFTWHKVYAMKRRINVLLYLNRDWRESYGGHLQLWSRDLSRCARRIMPLMGRCVVFSTSDTSFHGHPEPVACPPGCTRKSIAMYYYTAERDDAAVADTRKTEWQAVSQDALPPVE
jgi:Rps23 Pro-64 3,4-dihydroxylase Tpa1-like proline 4-hydroxylase